MKPRKKRRNNKNKDFQSAAESSFQADQLSQQQIEQLHSRTSEKLRPTHKLTPVSRTGDQETTGDEAGSQQLAKPYQFLKFASPSLHMIFFPHFTLKSITFVLSVIFTVLFILLLVFNYTKSQNEFRWNCSLYQLQNKFFPRLRYNYELWRVLVSGLFHSNIAHFCLNLFGMQVYGYFTQWYYGKTRYILALLTSVVAAHFFSAAINHESVSTMASATLFCCIALKVWFLYQYKDYRPLQNRRILIIILLVLITCINLIPIFVANNVDYGGHLGGVICGGLLGGFFHFEKEQNKLTDQEKEQYPRKWIVAKYLTLGGVGLMLLVCVVMVFTTDTETLKLMNEVIAQKCL